MPIANTADFRKAAQKRLPRLFFDYLDGGSYGERTLRQNVSDLEAVALRQRVMVDVSHRALEAEWFGRKIAMPVGLGPVGFTGMFRHRGEVQAARAAHKFNVPACVSTLGICGIEEITENSGAPVWQQFYMIRDRAFMADFLQRIAAARSPVLVFTADLPAVGARYRDTHSGMSGSGALGFLRQAWQGVSHPAWLWDVQITGGPHIFGNLAKAVPDAKGAGQFQAWVNANLDATVSWKDIEWVRARWKGPIVLKGVLDPADAKQALAAGADGIIVSNHGGRQLDGALSSIRALPAIADALGGALPILMDGGVRSGLDVLRAMAHGAQGVLLGRAWAYALAAQGEAGVTRLLQIIRDELSFAMAMTGCTDIRRAGRDLLA